MCLKGIHVPESMRRYAVPEAALSVITEHMPLFGDLVVEPSHCTTILAHLVTDVESRAERVRHAAAPAIRSFLKHVAARLASGEVATGVRNKVLGTLLRQLQRFLGDTQAQDRVRIGALGMG